MASTVSGKSPSEIVGSKELRVDITRFVTGAQKTERHHVETAFDVCLETAKLVIKESTLD
jgi:hypothetical protein